MLATQPYVMKGSTYPRIRLIVFIAKHIQELKIQIPSALLTNVTQIRLTKLMEVVLPAQVTPDQIQQEEHVHRPLLTVVQEKNFKVGYVLNVSHTQELKVMVVSVLQTAVQLVLESV